MFIWFLFLFCSSIELGLDYFFLPDNYRFDYFIVNFKNSCGSCKMFDHILNKHVQIYIKCDFMSLYRLLHLY